MSLPAKEAEIICRLVTYLYNGFLQRECCRSAYSCSLSLTHCLDLTPLTGPEDPRRQKQRRRRRKDLAALESAICSLQLQSVCIRPFWLLHTGMHRLVHSPSRGLTGFFGRVGVGPDWWQCALMCANEPDKPGFVSMASKAWREEKCACEREQMEPGSVDLCSCRACISPSQPPPCSHGTLTLARQI